MTNNFSESTRNDTSYSLSREIAILKIGVNILVLKELGLISAEDLINLMKMIRSPDLENHTIAETIVNNLLKNIDDVKGKT